MEKTIPEVTMLLSERDSANADHVREIIDARSKAHTVSIALALARFVVDQIASGAELMVKNPDGQLAKVFLPDLTISAHRRMKAAGAGDD